MAFGKWLLEKRSLPDLPRFYFTPADPSPLVSELRWSWLGDILLYLSYALGGAAGLQILALVCLVDSCFFLSRLGPSPAGPWVLLLGVLVVLGTYQSQMPRNAGR